MLHVARIFHVNAAAGAADGPGISPEPGAAAGRGAKTGRAGHWAAKTRARTARQAVSPATARGPGAGQARAGAREGPPGPVAARGAGGVGPGGRLPADDGARTREGGAWGRASRAGDPRCQWHRWRPAAFSAKPPHPVRWCRPRRENPMMWWRFAAGAGIWLPSALPCGDAAGDPARVAVRAGKTKSPQWPTVQDDRREVLRQHNCPTCSRRPYAAGWATSRRSRPAQAGTPACSRFAMRSSVVMGGRCFPAAIRVTVRRTWSG